MRDIKWFILVLILHIFVYGGCFYLLGKNQDQFDELTAEELEGQPFQTMTSSMWYIWALILGMAETESFDYGNGDN